MTGRIQWLSAFRRLIVARADDLCDLMLAEVHKPRGESMSADVATLLAACRWHEYQAPSILADRSARGTPIWLMYGRQKLIRAPLGRVGIIATWNYPVQLLGIQLVQALIAGNDVLVKPSERSPKTQSLLLELAQLAGLPDGALVQREASRDAGRRMIADDHMDHLVFTGSSRVGGQIAEMAAARLLPTTLELSGMDSAIVLDDADVARAAQSIWFAVTANGGQTCMAPRRALVHASVYRSLLDALAPPAAGAKPRRLIDASAAGACYDLACDAVANGGRSLSGTLERPVGESRAHFRPLAIVDCPRESALMHGDHFGPVLAVTPVGSVDDAVSLHRRDQEGGLSGAAQHLSASIFTRNTRRAREIGLRLNSSFITINDCVVPQAHPASPIAGVGRSGWGASRGVDGLLAMTRPVTIASPRRGPVAWTKPPSELPTSRQSRKLDGLIKWLYR